MRRAKEVMTSQLQTVDPDATLQSAAHLMKAHDVGILPVITKEGRAVGMISDRDIAVRGVAAGRTPTEAKVRDAMTSRIEFCYEDEEIEQLARHMGNKKLHRMVVVDRDSKGIKGIVSLGDLALKSDNKSIAGTVLADCVDS
jgi:CBS domain-containing protein